MNRPKQTILVGLLLAASVTYGCKNFLDSPPQGSLNDLTLQSESGVQATLIGAYRMLGGNNDWGSAPSNWAFATVPSDESYKGSSFSDQPPIAELELYNWEGGQAQSYIGQKWAAVFEGVSRANATLRLLDQVVKANPSAISEAEQNSIRGEAKFLRAHFEFEAYQMWKNVPYYKEDAADYYQTNQGVDVVGNILADLDSATALLPATPWNGEKGRVTSWTAKAYKGKVQMFAGDYAGALATFKQFHDNGTDVAGEPYHLEDNYYLVWTATYRNGPETILAYQASVGSGGGTDGNNGNYGERLNLPYGDSYSTCCGFNNPTQNLVNFFRTDPATGLPLAIAEGDLSPLDASGAWNASDADFVGGPTNKVAVDPRLDWTVGRKGVPYKDWGLPDATWVRDSVSNLWYNPKKNAQEIASGGTATSGWTQTQLNNVPMHIYRYADLLLMEAEAMAQTGDLPGAMQIVNLIRDRAARAVQGCGLPADKALADNEVAMYPQCAGHTEIAVPMDDPTVTWANYRIGDYTSFPSKDYALTAIRYERRLELAMEGHRLFDLQRWGIAAPVLNSYIAKESTRIEYLADAQTVTEPKFDVYPIPQDQIELSTVGGQQKLVQNPGW